MYENPEYYLNASNDEAKNLAQRQIENENAAIRANNAAAWMRGFMFFCFGLASLMVGAAAVGGAQ